MIRLIVAMADAAIYVPAPCRGCLAGMKATFQTNTVEASDTIVASQGATAVNTLTVVDTAGLVVETGVPDATNAGLVFDPDSTTDAEQVIVLTPTGSPGASLVLLEFDEYAYVEQTASEA